MRRTSLTNPTLLLIAAVAGCAPGADTDMEADEASASVTATVGAVEREAALRQDMRELWAYHVIWTRDYINAAVADHPSAQAALDLLMRNQEEIGAAVTPYYGDAAGDSLTALLKSHIEIAGEVVTAAKAGNTADLEAADGRWHTNADQIAAFLSGANPNWSTADLSQMLNEHLRLTTEEATSRLTGDWGTNATSFEQIFDQAMMMADALTDGIVAQFPDGPTT